MNGTYPLPRCTHKNTRPGARPLGVEALDSRLMMSASPLTLEPAVAVPAHEDRAATQLIAPDQVVAVDEAPTLVNRSRLPGGGAYPNPEDDDGDWGPLGPWVHEALDKLAGTFAHQLPEQLAVRALPGGGAFYPAPDDDGDWGPAGPVVHGPLFTAGDANLDFRFDQRDIVQMLQGGKYLTGERATWKDGDFNHDGVFDQLDIVAAQQTDSYLRTRGVGEEVVIDLLYAT